MKQHSPYQQVLAMVIGLSLLSVLLKQEAIAWVSWGLGFLCLAWEDFANGLTVMMAKVAEFVFGNLLRVVLALIYFIIITPIALTIRKRRMPSGWQEAEVVTKESLARTG